MPRYSRTYAWKTFDGGQLLGLPGQPLVPDLDIGRCVLLAWKCSCLRYRKIVATRLDEVLRGHRTA
jgi:hypothetical protein